MAIERSLHEATARKGRKEPNRTQKRNSKNTPYYKGFWLNDKVFVLGQVGYITGFTSGSAYIKNKNDEYITLPNKSYKQVGITSLKLLSHNNNWQYIRNACYFTIIDKMYLIGGHNHALMIAIIYHCRNTSFKHYVLGR